MDDIFCPVCGKANPAELDKCQFCGSRLKPLASSYMDATPIKPGENPVIKNTSEFEKVKLTPPDLVHPGEEPTVKSTASLESTLPSWLRTLRNTEESSGDKTAQDTSPDQNLPMNPPPETNPEAADDLPDWLPDPAKAESDDEKDVPDWLASLRDEKPDTSAQDPTSLSDRALNTTGSLSAGVADTEWMARLGGEPKPETSETSPQNENQGDQGSLDWLDSLGSDSTSPGTSEPPFVDQDEALHAWLSTLPATPEEQLQPASGEKENLTPGLEQSPEQAKAPEPTQNELIGSAGESEPPSTPIAESELAGGTGAGSAMPDWLANLGSIPVKAEEFRQRGNSGMVGRH